MAYGTNSNGGYSGTIIASSIRPADPLQTIATVFSNEIKGALHSYETIAERNALIVERRDWGMLVVIYNDPTPANNKTYQLTYGYSSTTLTDNLNWKEFSGSGGSGGGEWLDSVLTVSFSEPVSPSNGDRYLVGRNQSDSISGTNWLPLTPGFVAQWNSSISNWEITYPTNGMSVRVDDEDNSIYRYEGIYTSGGGWQKERESQVRRLVATQTGGGSYSATSTPIFNQYDTDSLYIVKFTNTNVSASVSLNVNGLGHALVKKTDGYILSDIYSGQIKTGYQYIVTYNGTFFELLDPSSGGGGTSSYDGSIKYNITPQDNIIVKPNTQYWVYGDLNIDGSIDNMGHVVVTNGSVTIGPTGSFNVGTWSNVYFAEINGLGQNNYVPRWTSPYMLTATSSIMDDGSAVDITGSTFSINSDIIIPSGASAGYVLTSDASGNSTWDQRLPYKVYVALLTQTSSNAPIAVELENTFGITATFSYTSTGYYELYMSGQLTSGKTFIVNGCPDQSPIGGNFGIFITEYLNTTIIRLIVVDDGGTFYDDGLNNTSIEIRVYP